MRASLGATVRLLPCELKVTGLNSGNNLFLAGGKVAYIYPPKIPPSGRVVHWATLFLAVSLKIKFNTSGFSLLSHFVLWFRFPCNTLQDKMLGCIKLGLMSVLYAYEIHVWGGCPVSCPLLSFIVLSKICWCKIETDEIWFQM